MFNTKNLRSIVINSFNPGSSIYRYTSFLNYINNNFIINIVNNKNKWNKKHLGMDFYGRFNNKYLNFLLPKYAYNNIERYIKNENVLLHYASQTSTIFFKSDYRLVTVHDNPFSEFETNLYFDKNSYTNKLLTKYYKYTFKKYVMTSPYITANTDYVKNSVIDYGYVGYIETIYIPVAPAFRHLNIDKMALRKELNLPYDKILLLSVSTDVYKKNLKLVYKLDNIINNNYRIVRVGTPVGNSINFSNIDDETLNKIYNG